MPRDSIEIVDERGSGFLGRPTGPLTSINELELGDLLQRYWPRTSADVLREAIGRGAPVIAREARRATEFANHTGRLRRSIRVRKNRNDARDFVSIVAGGPRAPHGHFIEFGTRDRYTRSGRKQSLARRIYEKIALTDRRGRRTTRTVRRQEKERRERGAKFRGRVSVRAFLYNAARRGIRRLERSVVNFVRRKLARALGQDTPKVRGKRRR